MLSVLYLVSHLDRANIGNAKIAGLTSDLGLSGIQYNIALSLFFIPYVLLGMVHSAAVVESMLTKKRGAKQHTVETLRTAILLSGNSHYLLGDHHDFDGCCSKLRWSGRGSHLAGNI